MTAESATSTTSAECQCTCGKKSCASRKNSTSVVVGLYCAEGHEIVSPDDVRQSPEGKSICRACEKNWQANSEHGSPSRYSSGCRCSECRSANAERTVRRHKGVNVKTRTTARSNGQRWTAEDLTQALRDDVDAQEVAKAIGRTYYAVISARHRATKEPGWVEKVMTR